MIKVLLPWNLPAYRPLNACHPLLYSLVKKAPEGVRFVMADPARHPDDAATRHLFRRWLQDMHSVTAQMGHYDACQFSVETIRSYDPVMQMHIASHGSEVDIVFHHTTAVHMNDLPFILHFESLTSLFYPFVAEGETDGIDIRSLPAFAMVRDKLASRQCRAIFSHLQASVVAAKRCFDRSEIERKIFYIPLGVDLPQRYIAQAESKLSRPGRKGCLNILFTNSAHGQEGGFFLRGGGELLEAFKFLVSEEAPDSRLIIVSKKPSRYNDLPAEISDKIRWIEDRISDEELFDLLLWSDVFALPAVGLHSYSALRALKCGSVLICSDAPGYEELVTSPSTALMVRGRRDVVYRYEQHTGFMHSNYRAVVCPDQDICMRLANFLRVLAQDANIRHIIATQAYRHVSTAHAIEPWSEGVGALLKAAVGR